MTVLESISSAATWLEECLVTSSASPRPGQIVFEGPIASSTLGGERFVRIYLPGSYLTAKESCFPVLYIHDGQNAFSTAGDHVAFGWGNWQLDRTAGELSAAGRMQEIIMVAVDSGSERYKEYCGPVNRTVEMRRASPGAASAFERYRQFLVRELKPRMDREYRTRPGPASTGLIGSSMGGLCSLALAWQDPGVFGKAASISGAFQVERRRFISLLRAYTGRPKRVQIYLDSGVTDYSGGDDGRKDTAAVARELRRIGWREGVDLMEYAETHLLDEAESAGAGVPRDKWKEAAASQHNELYWRLRAWRALTFLFPPDNRAGGGGAPQVAIHGRSGAE
jgi:predicted alpha/beta superfamily hydrolase